MALNSVTKWKWDELKDNTGGGDVALYNMGMIHAMPWGVHKNIKAMLERNARDYQKETI